MTSQIDAIEAEIDAAFADSQLTTLTFAQSLWALLSVAEDLHLTLVVISPLSEPRARAQVDGLMNELTYPMRVCHKASKLHSRSE